MRTLRTTGWGRRRARGGTMLLVAGVLLGALVAGSVGATPVGPSAVGLSPMGSGPMGSGPVGSGPVGPSVASAPAQARTALPQGLRHAAAVEAFRAERAGLALWTEGAALGSRGQVLLSVLEAAEIEGLDPPHYHVDRIGALLDEGAVAQVELLLSDGLVAYAREVGFGRIAPADRAPAGIGAVGPEGLEILRAAAAAPDLAAHLAALPPAHAEYRALKAALAEARLRAAAITDWPQVAPGRSLKPGMVDPRVAELRRRLAAEARAASPIPPPAAAESPAAPATPGAAATVVVPMTPGAPTAAQTAAPPAPAADPIEWVYDPAIEEQVRAFQERSAIDVDGVVGPQTLEALNLGPAERVAQLIANMERWRWYAEAFQGRHILVNVGGYWLRAVEDDGTVAIDSAVIVGSAYRRTPLFSSEVTSLTFNPTWTVPPTILKDDMLPKLRSNPQYFIDRGFTIRDLGSPDAPTVDVHAVDWTQIDRGGIHRYQLRQAAGPRNPLGQIKFYMPNAHHVYLHDTSEPGKFKRAVRNFSSGCIRVEQSGALIDFVMAPKEDWSAEGRQKLLDSRRTRTLAVPQPVPVHLVYLTAWQGPGGAVVLGADAYGRDSQLVRAMRQPSGPALLVEDG